MAKVMYEGQLVETVDCTPTWEAILPMLIHLLSDGDAKGKESAKKELRRMAQIADKYVAAHKIPEGAKTIEILAHTIVLQCNDTDENWQINEVDEIEIMYALGQDSLKDVNYKGRFDMHTGYKLEWHILGRG